MQIVSKESVEVEEMSDEILYWNSLNEVSKVALE